MLSILNVSLLLLCEPQEPKMRSSFWGREALQPMLGHDWQVHRMAGQLPHVSVVHLHVLELLYLFKLSRMHSAQSLRPFPLALLLKATWRRDQCYSTIPVRKSSHLDMRLVDPPPPTPNSVQTTHQGPGGSPRVPGPLSGAWSTRVLVERPEATFWAV